MPRGQSFQLAGLRTLNRSLPVSSFPRTFLCQRARRRTRKQPGSLCSHPQRGGQQRGDSGKAGTRRRTSRLSAPALPQPPPGRTPGPAAPRPQAEEEGEAPAPGRPPGLAQPPRARPGPTAPSPGWGSAPSPPSPWPRPPPPPVSRAPRGGAGARFRHASARPCRHRAGNGIKHPRERTPQAHR